MPAIATVASVSSSRDGLLSAQVEIRPTHWSPGEVYTVAVSGSRLDLEDAIVSAQPCCHPRAKVGGASSCPPWLPIRIRHHLVRQVNAEVQAPRIDPTGRLVLFGFSLQETSPSSPKVYFTLKGSGIRLTSLTCRCARRQNRIDIPHYPQLYRAHLRLDTRAGQELLTHSYRYRQHHNKATTIMDEGNLAQRLQVLLLQLTSVIWMWSPALAWKLRCGRLLRARCWLR